MKKDATLAGKEAQRLLQKLESCEELFHNIITRSADGILIVDRDGRVCFANPAAETLFRLFGADLYGHPFGYPVVAGETTEIDFIPRGGVPGVAEMRIVETEWEGQPAFLATLRDITARKRMERDLQTALAESEAARDRIDGIIRSIAEGLIVTDADNRLILMNKAAEAMLGVFCREVLGLPIEQIFSGDVSWSKVWSQLELGEKFDLQLSGRHVRHPRTIQMGHSGILDKEGGKAGFVTVLQDVTREREIERMKSEFVSIAAHELRSPLTSIVGFAELILGRPDGDPEEQRGFLEIIKRQALVLSEIINTLLDISLIEAGRGISLKRENVTVADIIRQADPFIQMNSTEFRFEVNLAGSSTVLHVDRKKINQVLENLLSNAVKYSPGGGTIHIGGEVVGSEYLLTVADEGIGMTSEQAERIFDKFYRVDTSNTTVGGIGLGMNIVKNIVETHGGKIWVESIFGFGTTVRFTLPVHVTESDG